MNLKIDPNTSLKNFTTNCAKAYDAIDDSSSDINKIIETGLVLASTLSFTLDIDLYYEVYEDCVAYFASLSKVLLDRNRFPIEKLNYAFDITLNFSHVIPRLYIALIIAASGQNKDQLKLIGDMLLAVAHPLRGLLLRYTAVSIFPKCEELADLMVDFAVVNFQEMLHLMPSFLHFYPKSKQMASQWLISNISISLFRSNNNPTLVNSFFNAATSCKENYISISIVDVISQSIDGTQIQNFFPLFSDFFVTKAKEETIKMRKNMKNQSSKRNNQKSPKKNPTAENSKASKDNQKDQSNNQQTHNMQKSISEHSCESADNKDIKQKTNKQHQKELNQRQPPKQQNQPPINPNPYAQYSYQNQQQYNPSQQQQYVSNQQQFIPNQQQFIPNQQQYMPNQQQQYVSNRQKYVPNPQQQYVSNQQQYMQSHQQQFGSNQQQFMPIQQQQFIQNQYVSPQYQVIQQPPNPYQQQLNQYGNIYNPPNPYQNQYVQPATLNPYQQQVMNPYQQQIMNPYQQQVMNPYNNPYNLQQNMAQKVSPYPQQIPQTQVIPNPYRVQQQVLDPYQSNPYSVQPNSMYNGHRTLQQIKDSISAEPPIHSQPNSNIRPKNEQSMNTKQTNTSNAKQKNNIDTKQVNNSNIKQINNTNTNKSPPKDLKSDTNLVKDANSNSEQEVNAESKIGQVSSLDNIKQSNLENQITTTDEYTEETADDEEEDKQANAELPKQMNESLSNTSLNESPDSTPKRKTGHRQGSNGKGDTLYEATKRIAIACLDKCKSAHDAYNFILSTPFSEVCGLEMTKLALKLNDIEVVKMCANRWMKYPVLHEILSNLGTEKFAEIVPHNIPAGNEIVRDFIQTVTDSDDEYEEDEEEEITKPKKMTDPTTIRQFLSNELQQRSPELDADINEMILTHLFPEEFYRIVFAPPYTFTNFIQITAVVERYKLLSNNKEILIQFIDNSKIDIANKTSLRCAIYENNEDANELVSKVLADLKAEEKAAAPVDLGYYNVTNVSSLSLIDDSKEETPEDRQSSARMILISHLSRLKVSENSLNLIYKEIVNTSLPKDFELNQNLSRELYNLIIVASIKKHTNVLKNALNALINLDVTTESISGQIALYFFIINLLIIFSVDNDESFTISKEYSEKVVPLVENIFEELRPSLNLFPINTPNQTNYYNKIINAAKKTKCFEEVIQILDKIFELLN